ncbi:MAG: 7-cyano-7-deazaguanine synthase QueC [Pirellulaceae bacterium]|nr:7-cyano-7-deazaguanine synthase QueC [Pirellulaceae bacterium]
MRRECISRMTASTSTKPCVVLLSGGLDSATVLAIARRAGYRVHAISFRYGQRHTVELQRAVQQAQLQGVAAHVIMNIDLAQFGGSALTTDSIAVPKHDSVEQIGTHIPVTYVPARNTVFLSLALAYAETISANDIFIGVNALDFSGYPDCRPEYIAAFESLANLAIKSAVEGARVRIHTPLIHMTKAQIIAQGLHLGVDYQATSSCYDPDPITGQPCQHCDACHLRQRGFQQNGLRDPCMG